MHISKALSPLTALIAGVLCPTLLFAQATPAIRNRATVTVSASQSNAAPERTVNLSFPQGTDTGSIKVILNGNDVSTQFHSATCPSAVCLSAILTETDKLREGENVLYATGKNQDGSASSARTHFVGARTTQQASGLSAMSVPAASTVSPSASGLPTLSSFLPPSVAFNTLAPGGATPGANWIQIGTQETLQTGAGGQQIYSVIILDRQTLQQKTAAPESSPQCFSSGLSMEGYLASLAATKPKLDDLVIVGTNWGTNTDANLGPLQFSTYPIGGRFYNCATCQGAPGSSSPDIPHGYMAIGVLGAEPGTAYENYTTSGNNGTNANATGMLVLDASGDYNFQSSSNVEYMVQPGQGVVQTYIQFNNLPGTPNVSYKYWPPNASSSSTGYWLLVLDRNTLFTTISCPQLPESNGTIIIPNCGTFIATGGTQGTPANIAQLTAALNAVTPSQIAILTTVGTAGWGTPTVMAGNGSDNGTLELSPALQAFGIPDKLILETGAPGATFTMVGVPGLGGPLTGHNVLSTNYLSQQGQTGYIHGTFAKDNHGLYEPAHTQQEPGTDPNTLTTNDNANLQLGVVLSAQPVEWPIFAAPLFGNGTLSGQIDAYKYLSWYLLNNYYFVGQQTTTGTGFQYAVDPPYAYDIHYFFTGSLNTWIDIHTFDPSNVPFPPNSNGCGSCTWQGPDGTQLNFTVSEFADAQFQLHNEIADLTNVLAYLVTGSTNLKDVVAAGNSNSALSLLQAFSTVQGNINAQGVSLAQSTAVKVSPWHIVNMIAGDVSPVVTFVTAGEVNTANIKLADKALGIIGDLVTAAGSMNGGLSSGKQSSTADIPRLDYSLDTTVGQLAGLALQSQMLAGFDATVDSITGDWYKLNALGSSAISNQVLFSPTQVTQNTAINQITTAGQKSMYMSLIPSVFQDHFWNMTSGATKVADMGYTDDDKSCSSFYPGLTSPPSSGPPIASVSYPTYGGTSFIQWWYGGGNGYPFRYSEDPPYQDWYVLSLPFLNQGHANTAAQVMNVPLSNILFGSSPGQANLSIDEFVAKNGPMDMLLNNGASQWIDFSYINGSSPTFSPNTNAIGISPGNICSQIEVNGNSPVESPAPGTTVTTLLAPTSAVLGENVTLQAKVLVQATSAPAGGSVQFRDGSAVLQTSKLDATGSASYTTNALALGPHALTASYASTDGSTPSDSFPQTLTVYANSPDMQLSLSQTSVNVSYGSTSSATTLQVQPTSGMNGAVSYACTGLPVGMTCTFQPASGMLQNGVAVSTSFTITGMAPSTSSFGATKGWGLFLITVPLILVRNIRRNKRKVQFVMLSLSLLSVMLLGSLIGCSGNSKSTATVKETGSKTVLISATSGALTKTTALIVNVQ